MPVIVSKREHRGLEIVVLQVGAQAFRAVVDIGIGPEWITDTAATNEQQAFADGISGLENYLSKINQ